ncbi:MAG: hypothetical protein Q4E34_03160 [Synergistaceae bacterium]|nr:hypothetical protein [Synergistaceae bacterium]
MRGKFGAMYCPVKVNLTLHVLGRRSDGYHELRTVFWKKTGTEQLSVRRTESGNGSITVEGAKIQGKNLLDSVLEFASRKISVPPLEIKLSKRYPQGSGIGAGSGNAAALLVWLKENCGLICTPDEIAKLGADVLALAQDNTLNYAEGTGEKLFPLIEEIKLPWLIVFPRWTSSTPAAYRKLDEYRGDFCPEDADFAAEASEIVKKLSQNVRAGLLPNDFLAPALCEHPEYNTAFDVADGEGALAWGMCGSGSAMFFAAQDKTLDRLEKILSMQDFILAAERMV